MSSHTVTSAPHILNTDAQSAEMPEPERPGSEYDTSVTCLSSDEDDCNSKEVAAVVEAVQATDATTMSGGAPSMNRRQRKILSVKVTRSDAPKLADPFDYSQKYSEDAPFQEMGEMARVWKMFLEEYLKYDNEMVDDWRDALDVLLVFAALFSSVVSTFITQTAQSLQVDQTVISNGLLDELVEIGRAIADHESAREIPRCSQSTPDPSLTDIWVNGLWLVSLALSLTTALFAVLTKTWIHQYMSVPSGSPRSRVRIRQYRYDSLEAWHVPMIIGLLPVLMHASLGVFFAGLVIYTRSLHTTTSIAVNAIASFAFVVYVGTNLLPIFRPSCPYKTPLMHHSYTLFGYCCVLSRLMITQIGHTASEHLSFFIPPWCTPDVTQPADSESTVVAPSNQSESQSVSLRKIEAESVDQQASVIDARALSWLLNTSSSSTVHTIILQALSNIPIPAINVVKRRVPLLHDQIRDVLRTREYSELTTYNKTSYERLCRAFIRFDPAERTIVPWGGSKAPQLENSLARFLHQKTPEPAVAFLSSQLDGSAANTLDVLLWAKIFQNALNDGLDWLKIGQAGSPIWQAIIPCITRDHLCAGPKCKDSSDSREMELLSLRLHRHSLLEHRYGGPLTYDNTYLRVFGAEKGTEEAIGFVDALRDFMHESLCELVLHSVNQTLGTIRDEFPCLPADIRLSLALVRHPSILATSRSHDYVDEPALTKILDTLHQYVGIYGDGGIGPGGILSRHEDVLQATFVSASSIVLSDLFLKDILTMADKKRILHIVMRCTSLDLRLASQFAEHVTKSDSLMIAEMCRVVLNDFPSSLGAEIGAGLVLQCFTRTSSSADSSSSRVLVKCYACLARIPWLARLHTEILSISDGTTPDQRDMVAYLGFAWAYVDGLDRLGLSSEPEDNIFSHMLRTLTGADLDMLSVLLALSDSRGQRRLRLVGIRLSDGSEHSKKEWVRCVRYLRDFLMTDTGKRLYAYYDVAYTFPGVLKILDWDISSDGFARNSLDEVLLELCAANPGSAPNVTSQPASRQGIRVSWTANITQRWRHWRVNRLGVSRVRPAAASVMV